MENAATALCALERRAEAGLPVPPKAFAEGLRTVSWPGRCELIAQDPPTFLDGGHNPDAMAALREALKSMHIRRRVALICGFCGDKAVRAALKEIAPLVSAAWTVPLQTERALTSEALAEEVRAAGIARVVAMASVAEGIEAATAWAEECQGTVLILSLIHI